MAHRNILVHRRLDFDGLDSRGCIQCPSEAPPCQCSSQDQCTLISESCNACSVYECIAPSSGSGSSSGGISAGAVAGAVVASVVFCILVLGAFWLYRRRLRQRLAAESVGDSKPDVPARAEDVLNRPDPNEKTQEPEPPSIVKIYHGSAGTINLDPEAHADSAAHATNGHSPDFAQSNPFNDNHSIQTMSTGTRSNVIPIALVPPATFVPPSQQTPDVSAAADDPSLRSSPTSPVRPARDPNLDLDIKSIDVQHDQVRPGDELSQYTGLSNRASYLSTGSYASDLLTEAPVIVRPTRGIVQQQVVGVVKAEVIRTSPGNTPSRDGLGVPQTSNRPPVRSPLAASSFGPSDVLPEAQEDTQEAVVHGNPFGDEHSPDNSSKEASPSPSQTTFGSPQDFDPDGNRPISTYTQAASFVGSVYGAEIGGATRVHLGLGHLRANPLPAHGPMPHTASSGVLNSPRSVYRMTSAKLVNTSTSGNSPVGTLERQQQHAMQQIETGPSSRASMSSVVSSASTKADSILESFPFVPPSPISNRPIRTPPRSPLAQQSFAANTSTPVPPSTPPVNAPPPRESIQETATALRPPPRNQRTRAVSVASQSSTFTNGLGSFPFQIDSGASDAASVGTPPSSFVGRTRASLDTLALTSDLSSYPLNFSQGTPPPMPRP